VIFLDHENILLGIGDRTNPAAMESLRSTLPSFRIHPIDLPEGFLHLDVVLNIIAPHTALAYTPALPADSISLLEGYGVDIIDISPDEQETMATNVLAIGNDTIIAASCNQKTNGEIRRRDFEVIELEMSEILKGGGGPRCMTLPVLRYGNTL
jgi:N-dimethylarginine dimethylaminohydrolase